jgi:hypothetical protein
MGPGIRVTDLTDMGWQDFTRRTIAHIPEMACHGLNIPLADDMERTAHAAQNNAPSLPE